jgi:hypothetical protein
MYQFLRGRVFGGLLLDLVKKAPHNTPVLLPRRLPNHRHHSMSGVDPADGRVQARAELGLLSKLAQPRRVEPHPRRGGSSGYPVLSREEQLKKWNAGEETLASQASLYRWSGRIDQYCRTGNSARTAAAATSAAVYFAASHPCASSQHGRTF